MSYVAARAFAEAVSAVAIPASITFLGSVGASRSHRYKIAYDAAMAGVEALARGFALEYASAGITTRVAAVGPIADSRTSIEDDGRSGGLVALMPARRYPTVEEVATAVIAFGGPAFDIATGAVLPLDVLA
ncbi:MAG: SDR family oxidoreductase [Pseudonocardiaceae bacterium]